MQNSHVRCQPDGSRQQCHAPRTKTPLETIKKCHRTACLISMRSDIVPRAILPDYELSTTPRSARSSWNSKDNTQWLSSSAAEGIAQPDFVGYIKIEHIKMHGPSLGVKRKLRLSEVVCKNVSGLLVERIPGHDEDSRAPVLTKGPITLRTTIFYNRLGMRR
jgi:hypothetical protein